MFYLTLALSNFLLFSFFLSSRGKTWKSSTLFKLYFIALVIGLFVIELSTFFMLKSQNLYEIHDRPRTSFDPLLKNKTAKATVEASAANPLKLKTTRDVEQFVLNNTEFQLFYDKYGDLFIMATNELQSWKRAGYYVLEKNMFESLAFYFGALIVSIYFYKKLNYKTVKKWICLSITACFLFEVDILIEFFQTDTFIDNFLPNLATFERIMLAKIIFVYVGNVIIAYYSYVKKSRLDRLETMFETISAGNQKLIKLNPKRNRPKADFGKNEIVAALNSIENSTTAIGNHISNEKKLKEEKEKSNKIFYYMVILFMVLNVLYTLPIVQDYIVNKFRSNNTGSEE